MSRCGDTGICADCAASEFTKIRIDHCGFDGLMLDYPTSALRADDDDAAPKLVQDMLFKSLRQDSHTVKVGAGRHASASEPASAAAPCYADSGRRACVCWNRSVLMRLAP